MTKPPLTSMDTENFVLHWDEVQVGMIDGMPSVTYGGDHTFKDHEDFVRWLMVERMFVASILERITLVINRILVLEQKAAVERTQADEAAKPGEAKP